MKSETILNAMGKISDALIEDAKLERKIKPTVSRRGWMAIAACFILLLGTAITVDATSGAVSNLLAPLFGMAQTEIVNDIGVPIGACVSADGYTLTVDAVIGDRYNVAIVYTLSNDDGQPIPEGTHFNVWETDIIWGTSGSGSLIAVKSIDDPSKLHFVESWNRKYPLIGRYVSASFGELEISIANGEDTILADGPWELDYTLCYKDTSVSVPVSALKVTDSGGEDYQINEILISPVGLRMDGIMFDPQWREAPPFGNFEISVRMNDGTVTQLEDCNAGGGYSTGDKTAKFHFNAMFEIPLELEEIDALIICGTEHAVKIAE